MSQNTSEGQGPLTEGLDHLVIDVGEQIDAAEATYRALGFHLTPRGYHTLGSVNHLAVFAGPYLELLGTGEHNGPKRPDVAMFPQGLNGLVFQAGDVQQLYQSLLSRNIPAQQPVSFSRPVTTSEGFRDARFDVIRLAPSSSPFGRAYFCHHLTPELVWTADGQQHPNTVFAITQIRVLISDPTPAIQFLEQVLGDQVSTQIPGGLRFRAGEVAIDLLHDIHPDWKSISPDPLGREAFMATLTLRCRSLQTLAEILATNNIASAIIQPGRLLIPAHDAFNVGLEFIEG